MPQNTIAIFGATGHQGSSVLRHILSTPSLSSQYSHIRALTRDPSSPKSLALLNLPKSSPSPPTIDLVRADVQDPSSLVTALRGVHTVFAMTVHNFAPEPEGEYADGVAIFNAAVEAGVEYIIWSTLPSASGVSGGRYGLLRGFDDKARVEEYIRGLVGEGKVRAAFVCEGVFMENFGVEGVGRLLFDDGKWVLKRMQKRESKLTLLAAVEDIGKFVQVILEKPDVWEGKTVYAAEGRYSFGEIVESMTRVMGREVVYEQVGKEEFVEGMGHSELWVELYGFFDEFGVFGFGQAEEEEIVKRAREVVRGERLMGLDEFFRKNPIKFE